MRDLTEREKQIAALLLQGYSNAEIAKELKMPERTVKNHFNRMFLKYGINDGYKRVKLAVLLFRIENKCVTVITQSDDRQELYQPRKVESSISLQKDSKIKKLQNRLGRLNMWLKTTFASSTTSSVSGIE